MYQEYKEFLRSSCNNRAVFVFIPSKDNLLGIRREDLKRLYDHEIAISWIKEKEYLSQNGIRYTFVKLIDGVSVYKYEKTEVLFNLLAQFYRELEQGSI